jgi:hypothetical protein
MPATLPADSETTRAPCGAPPARFTSPGVTAQTSQCTCVMRTSGRSWSIKSAWTTYSGSPVLSRRLTSASTSALGRVTSNAGDVQAGRRRTHSGYRIRASVRPGRRRRRARRRSRCRSRAKPRFASRSRCRFLLRDVPRAVQHRQLRILGKCRINPGSLAQEEDGATRRLDALPKAAVDAEPCPACGVVIFHPAPVRVEEIVTSTEAPFVATTVQSRRLPAPCVENARPDHVCQAQQPDRRSPDALRHPDSSSSCCRG